ncbi:MAG: acyltransferase family protein [Gammaproteobacteria bacterium]|nr:acyltransferase family protein [Gammaproteobacteria bacterium]
MSKREIRLSELDAFRGLAALSVVLFHYTTLYNERIGYDAKLPFYFPYGGYGVNLFFMISGFVIFLTLKRCRHHTDFIVSRFSRIYPSYWLAVIFTATVVNAYTLTSLHRTTSEIALNLTMLQGYTEVRHVDGVYWTLSYELLFYTFMYLIYRFKFLNRITSIIFIWLSLQLASILIERYTGWFPWKITLFFILGYIHLFAAGILFLKLYEGEKNNSIYLLLLYCLLIQWVKGDNIESIFVSAFFVLFMFFVNGWVKFIAIRPLLFLGAISYPLYLIHQNIGYVLINALQKNHLSAVSSMTITLITILLASTVITYYIEKPSMKYLRIRLHNLLNKETTGAKEQG